MSKSNSVHTSCGTPSTSSFSHTVPTYRIGDLIWCQETRNNKLWWPAMVTYDPLLGIFYRTTKQKCLQYHVQYFGISAIRGWVAFKTCVPFSNVEEKKFDEKGLSKKVRAEYEVAIQEVSEAGKLDYKQRKLKFIFSFGRPHKGGKKSKQGRNQRETSGLSEKTDLKEEPDRQAVSIDQEVTVQEEKTAGLSSKRPSKSLSESGLSSSVNGKRDNSRLSMTTSNVVKSKPSVSSRLKDKNKLNLVETPLPQMKKEANIKEDVTLSKREHYSHKNGQWSLGKNDKATYSDPFPVCLHADHYTKPSTRRRPSESSCLECDQCMDYINSSEGIELTCSSDPEIFDPDTGVKSILMYVQKDYSSTETLAPSQQVSSLPNLNHIPLTKGASTKNVSTDQLSRSSMSRSASSGRDQKSGSSAGLLSLPSSRPSNPTSSSNGHLNSKNECEDAQVTCRKRRKTSNSTAGLTPSSMTELQSGIEVEEPPATRKRKHESCSSSTMDIATSAETEVPVKRMRKANTRYSQQQDDPKIIGKVLNHTESGSVSAQSTASCVDDSCSDLSTNTLTSTILTPPTSSSEESQSVDLESDSRSAKGTSSSLNIRKKKSKLSVSPIESKILRICNICDCEDTDLLMCTGHCLQSFHLDCLGLMEEPSFKFLCDECLISLGNCFICGKNHGEVKKCSKPKCSKLYHLDCIGDNKLFQFGGKSLSFSCPLHVCAKCTSIGISATSVNSSLLQCVKCPLALHKPDCLVAGCEIIDQTHMVCYQHLKITKNVKLYSHINLNTCLECGAIGSLYCCDVCSAAYHLQCLDEDSRPASDGSHWKCPSCTIHDIPTYGSLVITKFGVWRWWPSEVVHPEDIPDNILARKPGDCMFVVRFCGSRDFCWTYHGRVIPYMGGNELDGIKSKKAKASENYKRACAEVKEIHRRKRMALEAKEAARQNSKFYTKIKTNKYLVPRPPLDLESLDFLPCQCTPENPCKDDSTCVNKAIHIECNPKNCPVGDLCQNQRMQRFQNAKTETFFTGNRGWGLKAAANLSLGDFVIEYVGEVLDKTMCKERLKKAHALNTNNFYMLTLDAGLVIDASRKSNHARFINHSCSPNCETQKWRVRGEPRIGIFTRCSIPAGMELTFDYHLDSLGNEKKKCFCGSKNCSGFLGLRSSKVIPEEEVKVKSKPKKKKKPRPRLPTKRDEEESLEDTHDDDCFICNDGGELLLCDHKSCTKAYHLECINRKVVPPKSQKWECPWHYCSKCQKAAVTFCGLCPVSFCSKHFKNEVSELTESCYFVCKSCSETKESDSVENSCELQSSDAAKLEEVSEDKMESSNKASLSTSDESSRHVKPASSRTTDLTKKNRSKSSRPVEPLSTATESKVDQNVFSPKSSALNEANHLPKDSQLSLTSPSAGVRSRKSTVKRKHTKSQSSPKDTVSEKADFVMVQSPRITADSIGSPHRVQVESIKSPTIHTTPTTAAIVAVEPQKGSDLHMAVNSNTPRVHDPIGSPSAFRSCLNRAPLFQHAQALSPPIAQSYPSPIPDSHSAKFPDSYMEFGSTFARASGFQHPQQSPVSFNPVWFMPRNGLMNGLEAGAAGFGYSSYPSALINPTPLGFSYPGYFGETVSNFESFNFGMHQLPSTSSASSSVQPPPSFPAVFPPTHPQNGFLAWKYR